MSDEKTTTEVEDDGDDAVESGGAGKRKVRMLTNAEQFALWTELKVMANEIETGKMSKPQVLPELAQRTKIPDLTINHLRTAGKTVGVTFYRRIINTSPKGEGGGKYLAEIRERVRVLEEAKADSAPTLDALVQQVASLTYRLAAIETALSQSPPVSGRRYRLVNGLIKVV